MYADSLERLGTLRDAVVAAAGQENLREAAALRSSVDAMVDAMTETARTIETDAALVSDAIETVREGTGGARTIGAATDTDAPHVYAHRALCALRPETVDAMRRHVGRETRQAALLQAFWQQCMFDCDGSLPAATQLLLEKLDTDGHLRSAANGIMRVVDPRTVAAHARASGTSRLYGVTHVPRSAHGAAIFRGSRSTRRPGPPPCLPSDACYADVCRCLLLTVMGDVPTDGCPEVLALL